MLARVLETIKRYRMFGPGARVAVAVSGGADSVCLLQLLRELGAEWRLALSVLHVDHGLRGAESEGDAEYVRRLASGLGLGFTLRCVDLRGVAGNLEAAAREARLAFFRETVASGAADRVALGHTRSDQAETVLFRFLRGAGTAGLAGIRPVTAEGLVRPLLGVDRSEVAAYLRDRHIDWREDSSNASTEFARNRIRHQLLPQLEREWNPSLSRTLAAMADWASAEEEYWRAETAKLAAVALERRDGAVLVDAGRLQGIPEAARRRLMRRAMELVKGDLLGIEFQHVAGLVELAGGPAGHGRMQAPGIDAMRSFEWLRIARPGTGGAVGRDYRLRLIVPGETWLPGCKCLIRTETIEKSETMGLGNSVYNNEMGCLDLARVTGPLELRNWQPGDQYRPTGHSSQLKIKTLFQNSRVPLWERRHWPVVVQGSEIVWTRRFGAAAHLMPGPETRWVLAIREREENLDASAKRLS